MIKILLYKLINFYHRKKHLYTAYLSFFAMKCRGTNYKKRTQKKQNIKVLINKVNKNKKKRLALFVAYHNSTHIPLSNIEYIKFLSNCDFEVVYIHNGKLDQFVIERLIELGCYLIIRDNIGQDFGAWKDAFSILEEHKIDELLDWILICNDSNFCLDGSNNKFAEYFTKNLEQQRNKDFISLNCNFEYNLHFQSFFICFGKAVFNSIKFKDFWKQYKIINNRYYAIEHGEMKLSKEVLSLYKGKVLLNNYELYQNILLRVKDEDYYSFLDLIPKNQFLINKLFKKNKFRDAIKKTISILESYNPSHVFALLFVYFYDSPFLKKDIVKSGLYSLIDIHELLLNKSLKEELLEEIMETYIKGGTIYSFASNIKEASKKGIPHYEKLHYFRNLDTVILDKKERRKIISKSLPINY